ncbi:hypothetical protein SAMN05660860_02935 [Geoalkalibacter ferrihydriticus]|uniref:DUF2946 domain-containing protein n=2 Tax=Geoalkalibacter ferrihydriticus TaxID=392333 RepID=A0A0C2EB38_9BACT|nr:hypothetical protein [Geoalkalibacter ferrihydriticus]KIH75798.1 hypothetical protein GFER_14480 [Geoalkalibacter ferrihydriticus DSM 17813]SDM65553.1 hypothetical protein SAMN05660860_02935 [Geoalkalibacter ferrihydriticus]
MSRLLRKIVILPLLLTLLLVMSSPTHSVAVPEKTCCAHAGHDPAPDVADVSVECPFCGVVSFDLTTPFPIHAYQTESRSLPMGPAAPNPSQFFSVIDWPPERG